MAKRAYHWVRPYVRIRFGRIENVCGHPRGRKYPQVG